MCALPIIGSGGNGGISASYLNQIIQETMALQRKPLEVLQADQKQLQLERAVYSDLKSMLDVLRTEASELDNTSANSVFKQRSVTCSDNTVVTASASSLASAGTYTITDVQLGAAHQVRSGAVAHADVALNLEGTFVVGGAAARTASLLTAGNAVTGALASNDVAPAAGQTELGSGEYRVEFQQIAGEWKFRLLDDQDHAVSIKTADGSYSSGWQTYAEGEVDTGRGLRVVFAGTPSTALGDTAVKIDYTARGAEIGVAATDTLLDIRDKINAALYAEGNGVQASILNDQYLVLGAKEIGYQIEGSGTIFESDLGFAGDADADGDGFNYTLAGWTKGTGLMLASLKVNGISISRTSNDALADAIAGVSLNLLKNASGPITLTVSNDRRAVTGQVNSFLSQLNKVTSYLKDKTSVTKNSDGTYTRQALAGNSTFEVLRMNLMSDLLKSVDGVASGDPSSLRELGIGFDPETLQLSVSDSSKLDQALQTNYRGVSGLLHSIMSRVQGRLDLFSGTEGLLSKSMEQMDHQVDNLASRIKDSEARLSAQETVLTRHYARVLAELADVQAQASLIGVNLSL